MVKFMIEYSADTPLTGSGCKQEGYNFILLHHNSGYARRPQVYAPFCEAAVSRMAPDSLLLFSRRGLEGVDRYQS